MFLGRPVNLWTGLISGISNAVLTMTAALLPSSQAQVVAICLGGFGTILGILIAFLAGQPPTLNPGDTFKITTPSGQPNTTGVVTPPEPVTVASEPAAGGDA